MSDGFAESLQDLLDKWGSKRVSVGLLKFKHTSFDGPGEQVIKPKPAAKQGTHSTLSKDPNVSLNQSEADLLLYFESGLVSSECMLHFRLRRGRKAMWKEKKLTARTLTLIVS